MKSSKKRSLKNAFARTVPCHGEIAAKKGQFVLALVISEKSPRVEKTEDHYLGGTLAFACGSVARSRVPIKITSIEINSGGYAIALGKGTLRGAVDAKTGKGTLTGFIVLSDSAARWKKTLRAKFDCAIQPGRGLLEFASAPFKLRIPSVRGAVSARFCYAGKSDVIALDDTTSMDGCTNNGQLWDVWCSGDCNKGRCVVWTDSHDGLGWQAQNYSTVYNKAKGVEYLCACN